MTPSPPTADHRVKTSSSSPTRTSIAWTDYTVNFWWGCTKVSPACKHCYAETLGSRFGPRHFGAPVLWGPGKPRSERLQAARAEALEIQRKSVKHATRYRVFVNSMSDWLDDEVPVAWLAYLLETLHLCPDVDFQLLTKRPENWRRRVTACYMEHGGGSIEFTNWLFDWTGQEASQTLNYVAPQPPPNLWLGVTAENNEWATKRIPHLLRIPAKVHFLSCEPLSTSLNLDWALHRSKVSRVCPKCLFATNREAETHCPNDGTALGPDIAIDWVIAGGESGTHSQPSDPAWFRSLRDQCASAGVPFFFKQWGEWLPQDHLEAALAHALETGIPYTVPRKGYKGQHLEPHGTGPLMLRPGTQIASNLLDGQKWEQFPVSTPSQQQP